MQARNIGWEGVCKLGILAGRGLGIGWEGVRDIGWEGVRDIGWEGVRDIGWESVRNFGWGGGGQEAVQSC